ncbi:DUF4837 family protein [Anditalea andensis]|nr:DUF4837 family protein [Anditalea andensis]
MFGCNGEEDGGSSNKPQSRGATGEILLVIDSLKWQGPVGEALQEVFQAEVPGIMRPENLFSIRRVDPRAITRMLKMAHNIVYVTTFDDRRGGSQRINTQFSEASREVASDDRTRFMLRSPEEFAAGQEVVYLFGNTEEELINNLRANKGKLQNLFQTRERERLAKAILNRKSGVAANLGREKFGIELKLPASYQLVKNEDDFLWFRQPTPTTDRADITLFFYETDYESEDQLFPENLVQLRNNITRTRIFGDPANPESFVTTERREEPPIFNTFNVKNHYAVEMRGSWRTNNMSMGGSFLSYTMVDEERGKIYYMEGFVFYPSEAHREPLREIEAILLATDLPTATAE